MHLNDVLSTVVHICASFSHVNSSAFYEWKKVGAQKEPWRIVMKDRQRFAFAGLWERWKNPAAQFFETCTIVTTNANDLVAPIHDRMPVIVCPELYEARLGTNANAAEVSSLLQPYAPAELDTYRVSTLVNNPRNNNRECVEALAG